MLVTEEEAKRKWCPMSRTTMINAITKKDHSSVNRINGYIITEDTNCRGSACMSWRWEVIEIMPEVDLKNSKTPMSDAIEAVSKATIRRTGKGYCGLAGMPAHL